MDLKRVVLKFTRSQLIVLCKYLDTTPEDILNLDLEDIEDRTEMHVRKYNKARVINNVRIAPKRSNVQISALKTWLHLNRKIKNRKAFRELKFDKSSPLRSGLMTKTLEPRDMKKMFQFTNGNEDIVLGFYGLSALRPSLISYLKVKHIHPKSRKIEDGKITLK